MRQVNYWILLVVILLVITGVGFFSGDDPLKDLGTGRWYSQQQVVQGGPLFQRHCAVCHGPEAAGTPNWREMDQNGHYPPPPLNGSAHTWHHPLALLRKTVREGGIPLGGQMPPFKEVLTHSEIDAILAWVQTHWSDQIYQRWLERNG